MTPSPAIALLSDVLVRAIDRKGLSVILSDATNSTPCANTVAASSSGFLPAFLITAEALWFEMTRHGFGLKLADDPEAALGVTVLDHDAQSAVTVLLCLLDVLDTLPVHNGQINLCDLNGLWQASMARLQPVSVQKEQAA
ncbi:hypothetical protein [Gluconobacter cerinus]|uniref:Uncharacterized protein n=1 Tax=Gluconobacter cerinus TaxID=38307 RepID=A0A1B6VPQ7_9PROT|nr:hypothetical protein [Gluconobacter cerinus]OAJ69184.1 hypothetical protein A0123_00238 [Gluconobacter cerinus]